MTMLEIFLWCLGANVFLFVLFWIVGLLKQSFNSVDIAYGGGFFLTAVMALTLSEFNIRKLIITVLVGLWSLRIAVFLTARSFGKDEKTGEDKRFKKFRDEWGSSTWWKGFFMVYLPQVFLVLIVNFSVIAFNGLADNTWVLTDFIGIGVWIFGFLFETIADFQMMAFKNDPANKGKIMQKGLWKYSQHPNYFGEITQWIGLFIVAGSLPLPWAIASIISPLTIIATLVFVSGIPLLDRKYANNLEYQTYAKKTSKLIPWIPKTD